MKQLITVEAKSMTKLAAKVAKKQLKGYCSISGSIGLKNAAGDYTVTMSL